MIVLLEGEASRYPLSVYRDQGRWRQLLDQGEQEAAVYEAEAGTEGYLLYELREGDGSPHTLVLSELIAATPAARRALISFAAAFDPLMFAVKYSASRGEPLHPYLENSYVNARLAPEFMLRLVDVEGALKLLHRDLNAPFVLEVTDDVIPENAGEYTIGGDDVVRGAEASERATLDVRQLAQLYAGYLPAGQLARHGLLETSSPAALEILEARFPPGDPYVSPPDHF